MKPEDFFRTCKTLEEKKVYTLEAMVETLGGPHQPVDTFEEINLNNTTVDYITDVTLSSSEEELIFTFRSGKTINVTIPITNTSDNICSDKGFKSNKPTTVNVQYEKDRDELIDEMVEHAERFIRAAKSLKNGESIIESYNEIFPETKRDEREVINKLGRMIEHLLKLAYCPNGFDLSMNQDYWSHEVSNVFQKDLVDILKWVYVKQDMILINYARDNIEEAYSVAVNLFEKYLRDVYTQEPDDSIPEKCPWNLNELMDYSVDELLTRLP